jgi:alpha-beta hydrolase superfamily lysophospholipase
MVGPRVGFCLLVEVLFLSLLGNVNVAAQTAAAPPRVVDLTAADGRHLKATYFGTNKAGPGVLLLHQCNRQRKVWDDLARDMAASGLHVLTLDFRGFGESEGTPLDKLSPEETGKSLNRNFPATWTWHFSIWWRSRE